MFKALEDAAMAFSRKHDPKCYLMLFLLSSVIYVASRSILPQVKEEP